MKKTNMKKTKTSQKNAPAALEIAKQNYEKKLRELSQIEQQAHAASADGNEDSARQLMTQAIEIEQQASHFEAEIKELEKILNQKSKTNNLIPLLALIPLALVLVFGGYWYFTREQIACLPSGTKIRINGATSMAQINQKLKIGLEKNCPGVSIDIAANGTDQGIEELLAGKVNIAAVSRTSETKEQAKGLIANFIRTDAIAVFISKDNPFKQGLTTTQVADIFKGNITDWSTIVPGQAGTIRVINRPQISGTHRAFQELILDNAKFGTTPNITTHPIDETSPIIKKLGKDGISYASYAQVKHQKLARVVPIDNLMPDSPNYPHKRQLSYVYKEPKSPAVKAFLDYVNSKEGQQAIIEK